MATQKSNTTTTKTATTKRTPRKRQAKGTAANPNPASGGISEAKEPDAKVEAKADPGAVLAIRESLESMAQAHAGLVKARGLAFDPFLALIESGKSLAEVNLVFDSAFSELRAAKKAGTLDESHASALRTAATYASTVRNAITVRE